MFLKFQTQSSHSARYLSNVNKVTDEAGTDAVRKLRSLPTWAGGELRLN